MSATEARLIEDLIYNANASGHHPLEQRMADLAVWYYKNVKHIPRDNLAARQAFLEKAFWCQVELNALLLERIREMKPGSNLWLPRGIKVEGDVRQFG